MAVWPTFAVHYHIRFIRVVLCMCHFILFPFFCSPSPVRSLLSSISLSVEGSPVQITWRNFTKTTFHMFFDFMINILSIWTKEISPFRLLTALVVAPDSFLIFVFLLSFSDFIVLTMCIKLSFPFCSCAPSLRLGVCMSSLHCVRRRRRPIPWVCTNMCASVCIHFIQSTICLGILTGMSSFA